MQIKSPFKDYYDYVAHQYGGGDPKVVYVRNRLTPLYDNCDVGLAVNHDGIKPLPYRSVSPSHHNFQFSWLVVAGKYYLLVRHADHYPSWQIVDEETCLAAFGRKSDRKWWVQSYEVKDLVGVDGGPSLVSLSAKLNAPVFVIWHIQHTSSNTQSISIGGNIPILGELGMPKIISPEQLYQDIAYFIGNTMHGSPDIDTPVKIDDKDRIVQHGFDLKQSFRHRK